MTARTKYLYPKTVGGKPYLFFRYKGKLTPLPTDRSSIEFRRAYDACIVAIRPAKEAAPAPAASRVNVRIGFLPDTLGAAIEKYLGSTAFEAQSDGTKYQYHRTADELRERLGTGKLADLDTDAVDIHTEQVAKDAGASTADRHLRMLSLVWKTCRKYPQFKIKGRSNPTIDAERRYSVQQKHRPWPRDVQDRFMESAPEHLRIAKLLLHFSAQRGGDCVKMKWTDFDGRGLTVRPEKTHGQVEAEPNYHLCPRPLREALLAAPRTAETILVTAHGRPYGSANVLSHAIRRELVKLGLAKLGERTFVMHGLRKTAASDVGSLGVGAAGVKSVGGWRTDHEANYYAQHADKRRVNALVIEQWDAELTRQEAAAAEVEARRARIRRVK
jgi:integrase